MDGLRVVATAATILLVFPCGPGAIAQDAPPPGPPADGRPDAPEGDWVFRVGAAGTYGPEFEGADEYEFGLFPLIEVEYQERYFLSTARGAGIVLLDRETVQLDVAVGYDFGRDEDDSSDLDGLGDVDGGAVVNVGAEFSPFQETFPGLSFGADFSHQFTGDDVGFTLGADVGYRFRAGQRVMLRPSIGTVYASGEHMDAYFGVSSAQSAGSGLAEYDPGSGFKSVGGSLSLFYQFTRNWGGRAVLGYDRLIGDAADSPIVRDEDQFQAILGLAYRF